MSGERSVNKIIQLSVRLQCSAGRAFKMFTDNQLLQSWLTSLAEVEPKSGGKYELFWEPTDRENNSTIGCRVTGFEPDKFLSFEWRGPKQYKHFANDADPLTHVVVFFAPDSSGTDVYLIHSGWRSSAEWEQARQWQETAWSMALKELGERVNGSVDAGRLTRPPN